MNETDDETEHVCYNSWKTFALCLYIFFNSREMSHLRFKEHLYKWWRWVQAKIMKIDTLCIMQATKQMVPGWGMRGYLGFEIHVMGYAESGRGALGISFHRTDNLREQLRRGCQHLPNTQLGCLSNYNKTHMQSTHNMRQKHKACIWKWRVEACGAVNCKQLKMPENV